MPAGRIHDRITLWGLPVCGGLTLMTSGSSRTTLIICSGYLLGGLLLGPDLDIHSRPYKRWGWLRWIWLPYQKSVRHRSFWSHGFLVGTTLRVLYLGAWMFSLGAILLMLWSVVIAGTDGTVETLGTIETPETFGTRWWLIFQDSGQTVLTQSLHFLQQHLAESLFLFLGLEIGAMSHSIADRLISAWKRSRRRPKTSQKP